MGSESPAHEMRNRLLGRLAVAGALIVVAAGGLYWVERGREAAPRNAPGQSIQVAIAQAPAAASSSAASAAPEPPVVAPHIETTDRIAAAAAEPAPPAEEAVAQASGARPAHGAQPSATAGPTVAIQPEKPAQQGLAGSAKPATEPVSPVKGGPAKRGSGSHLQIGMFASAANAEALRAQLAAQGVPVYVESRVLVGPFKDKAEADRMRARLEALGHPSLYVPAR